MMLKSIKILVAKLSNAEQYEHKAINESGCRLNRRWRMQHFYLLTMWTRNNPTKFTYFKPWGSKNVCCHVTYFSHPIPPKKKFWKTIFFNKAWLLAFQKFSFHILKYKIFNLFLFSLDYSFNSYTITEFHFKILETIWNASLMQQGNFINVFSARHVSVTYAHHQERSILSCSIWFSAPRFWMSGGLESRFVSRVYGADVAVRMVVCTVRMVTCDSWCSWWWAYVHETCRAKNTSIKLPCCIKLAFHIVSWGRCTVKQQQQKKQSRYRPGVAESVPGI